MKIYNSIEQLVGHTPLFRCDKLKEELKLYGNIFVKLEKYNPTGSSKDRASLSMILDAEEKGKLKKGGLIIEPTSGNTGIGLACIGKSRGYRVILTMPDTMSKERIALIKAYGAEVVLTDGKLGMKGSIDKAEEINKSTPNSIIAGQFDNPANPKIHYKTTASEIYDDLDGNIDYFVAGVGSAGTLTGCGRFFKEKNKDIQIIAVEPATSPVLSKGIAGSHKIQGIGANFVPKNFDKTVCDKIMTVENDDAFYYSKLLGKIEGILSGISSGASLSAGITLAKMNENKDKNIVVILPDGADRYLSTPLFLD